MLGTDGEKLAKTQAHDGPRFQPQRHQPLSVASEQQVDKFIGTISWNASGMCHPGNSGCIKTAEHSSTMQEICINTGRE